MPAPRTGREPSLMDFVRALCAKTQSGQLTWQWFPDAITASVDENTFVGFSTSFAVERPIWRVFIVFDPEGRELRRVTPIAAAQQRPLDTALDELFFGIINER